MTILSEWVGSVRMGERVKDRLKRVAGYGGEVGRFGERGIDEGT